MRFTVCPSCGIASEIPHDSQQACIAALHAEISRTRQVLTHVGEPLVRPAPEPEETAEDEPTRT